MRTGHTGTSAKVYITLTGCKGRLLRQRLSKGGRKEMTFAPSSVEMFRVRGVDIGAITTVTGEWVEWVATIVRGWSGVGVDSLCCTCMQLRMKG